MDVRLLLFGLNVLFAYPSTPSGHDAMSTSPVPFPDTYPLFDVNITLLDPKLQQVVRDYLPTEWSVLYWTSTFDIKLKWMSVAQSQGTLPPMLTFQDIEELTGSLHDLTTALLDITGIDLAGLTQIYPLVPSAHLFSIYYKKFCDCRCFFDAAISYNGPKTLEETLNSLGLLCPILATRINATLQSLSPEAQSFYRICFNQITLNRLNILINNSTRDDEARMIEQTGEDLKEIFDSLSDKAKKELRAGLFPLVYYLGHKTIQKALKSNKLGFVKSSDGKTWIDAWHKKRFDNLIKGGDVYNKDVESLTSGWAHMNQLLEDVSKNPPSSINMQFVFIDP
ncbi:hypothetical protein L596_019776 [Steinernema carpocapsae]|uniref:Uncharacterized protein n=1 Tax=Steinernema carpocapsae TaxID=34508 RepID=A0A4V6A0Q0_STECR|nr:hypothetical protein L596_019776 [Steinernema carpocapsae]